MKEHEIIIAAQAIINTNRLDVYGKDHGAWQFLQRVTDRLNQRATEIVNEMQGEK